ncbi:MAG TPA: trigger factor [Stellaceae bacterium]|jgi:trigger factor|nr:trigger factor [Stellaceae bacterium]
MQVTETSADGLKREYKIVIPAGEVEDQISSRLTQLGRQIRLPGFRPGKVPQSLLRQRYGSAVRGEVLEHAVQESSAEAMREQNLRPALPPKVEIVSANEGADFEYTMSVELLPEMPTPDFNTLGLEKLSIEVPDDDVDKAIERVAEQYRKSEPVERAAEKGDIVVIDFVGKIGDTEFPGGKGDNVSLELGSGQFVPGYEDQLVGAKAGEDRTVNVTFPEGYGGPELAGKDANFAVKVKEVRERQPAKIDDSLAEEVGLEKLDELKQEVRERMARDYSMVTRQRLKRQLLDKLAETYSFAVPPGMVEIEFNNIWRQQEAEKAYETAQTPSEAGEGEAAAEASPEVPAEPAAPTEEDEKLKAEYQSLAERRVRLGLLLAEVGRNANISVTQDELNQALIREAQRFPGSERQVLDYYRKNPEAAGNLRAPIFEEKVVDYIVELAKPSERKVSPQELLAMTEADEGETEGETSAAQQTPAEKKPRRQTGARRAEAEAKGETE